MTTLTPAERKLLAAEIGDLQETVDSLRTIAARLLAWNAAYLRSAVTMSHHEIRQSEMALDDIMTDLADLGIAPAKREAA